MSDGLDATVTRLRDAADRALYLGAPDAGVAWLQLIRALVSDDALRAAADEIGVGGARAEQAVRALRQEASHDPYAPALLAEGLGRLGRWDQAEAVLAESLTTAPDAQFIRLAHIEALLRLGRWDEARCEVELVPSASPERRRAVMLKGVALERLGDHSGALEVSKRLLADYPEEAKAWLMHGHNLRTVGEPGEAADAYLRATALAPAMGEAWWALADLKTFPFAAEHRAAMRQALSRSDLDPADRSRLSYALAKAEEDEGDYAAAFRLYAEGAAIQRCASGYNPDEVSRIATRAKALLTKDYFSARGGWGVEDGDPIFIVGLPRSGSTLIEQILASHSAVEPLGERPEISALANWLARAAPGRAYPGALETLSPAAVRRLGQAYIAQMKPLRIAGRPLFTDKAPENWLHLALILTALPRARIIDARRHPLGACLSAFRQHFGAGWDFSYDLADLGRYYADYADLMVHVDTVRPGAVHRVIYENLTADPERETRRLLDYLGLPFQADCLRFYESRRAVATPSSEQVRRPISRDAVDHWRRFEPWLDPLKAALGPTLETWRGET